MADTVAGHPGEDACHFSAYLESDFEMLGRKRRDHPPLFPGAEFFSKARLPPVQGGFAHNVKLEPAQSKLIFDVSAPAFFNSLQKT